MFDFTNPQTMWLNLTNLVLGLVTLLAVLAVVFGIAKELVSRRSRQRAGEGQPSLDAYSGSHVFDLPDLGITMADGGEPLAPEEKSKRKRQSRP